MHELLYESVGTHTGVGSGTDTVSGVCGYCVGVVCALSGNITGTLRAPYVYCTNTILELHQHQAHIAPAIQHFCTADNVESLHGHCTVPQWYYAITLWVLGGCTGTPTGHGRVLEWYLYESCTVLHKCCARLGNARGLSTMGDIVQNSHS